VSGPEGIGASNEEILDIGLELVEAARGRGILLRLLGAVAIRLHCQTHQHLFDQAERPISDLDVMSYGSQRRAVQNLLKENKYIGDEHLIAIYGESRQIYQHPRIAGLKLDVFFDQLKFCHTVPFRGRLELDYPTITMTDALLEKMQIVKINAKDLKDTIILLLEHPPAEAFEPEKLDGGYLGCLLGADWGFYYTVTENLKKVIDFMRQEPFLQADQMELVERNAKALLATLEQAPKTLKWKLRARIGPKVKWYQDVEETGQIY
jgi:hypothetical protein